MAAAFTAGRFSRMDPELSMTMPIATGMSSLRNEVIFWGLPSSNTVKSFLARLAIRRLWSSTTVACKVTSSTSFLKTKTSPCCTVGSSPCCGTCTVSLGWLGAGGSGTASCWPLWAGAFAGGACAGGFCAGAVCWPAALPAGTGCPGVAGFWATIQAPKHRTDPMSIANEWRRLFGWCIVSRFGVHVQRWQTFRRIQFHLDLAPLAISYWAGWTVSEHILVAQLDANLCRHVRQFVRIADGKCPPSRHFSHLGEQGGSLAFFWRLATKVKQADAIDLNVGFPHHRLDLALGVAAVVVATVGDD